MKLVFSILIALFGTSTAFGQEARSCGTLTVRSSANIYSDMEADNHLGFAYPPGFELKIANIEGGMARVVWRDGNGVEAGQGFVRRSSFDTNAFDQLVPECSQNEFIYPFERNDETIANPDDHDLHGVNIRTSDNYGCLPPRVVAKLNEMVGRGWDVQLMSAHRSRADNARRGGARNSMHIQCRAADFIVNGVDRETVESYLLQSWSGGLGLYCSGRFHIDDGRHRIWGGCASSTNRSQYYSRAADRRRSDDSGTGAQP